MSIRLRITLFGLGVAGAVLGLFCAAVYLLLAAGAATGQDTALGKRADEVARSLTRLPAAADGPAPAAVDVRTSPDVFVMVLDAQGRVLVSTGALDGRLPPVPATATLTSRSTVDIGVPVRVAVREAAGGHVVAAQTTRKVTDDRRGLFVLVCVYAVLSLAAAAGATWLVSGRALKPLRQLTGHVEEIGREQDFTRRLPPAPARDDVGRLTAAFNTMMERLQGSYAAQRRFVADASHELRTPLTTIRNNAGFLRRHPDAAPEDVAAAVRDIAGESARMSRLVEHLLTLARSDASGLELRPVDLGALVSDVCRQAEAQHPDRHFHRAITPAPPVHGSPDALTQLVWILLDNAVKYSATGGNVWVTVTQRGDRAQLNVTDDGTGIPPGAERQIFERFHRGDEARTGPGAGLGLAIALSIVDAHGGTIVAANNATGGASFVADLPLSSSS
ncbi:HAMP domain-containing sensor histidine kinase [Dactylosporangium sp. NPDC006015]|uniref:sensor histidine kinase n=1 Tax=Dactylosporangium sp. NPDC006015 TaxID=3154576 RepID=UPI0033AEA2CF